MTKRSVPQRKIWVKAEAFCGIVTQNHSIEYSLRGIAFYSHCTAPTLRKNYSRSKAFVCLNAYTLGFYPQTQK